MFKTGLNELSEYCHRSSREAGWWSDLETGEPIERNRGEIYALIISEAVEAFEGYRKNLHDKHLPDRLSEEVELADLLIRICDLAGAYGFDIDGAVREKLAFNKTRQDHTPESRRKKNGKKF